MDVPDWKFQFTDRTSTGAEVGGMLGGHAANMLIPGAVMSGCSCKKRRLINQRDLANRTVIK